MSAATDALATTPDFFVRSPDCVPLGVWTTGSGAPLLLIHGTTSDHSTFNELVPHVSKYRRVYCYDRRGRGASGDASGIYSIDLEYGDAAAVAERVADIEGDRVDVLAHSFGAYVALGAAARTAAIGRVVAYSPGFGAEYPPGAMDRIRTAVASDDLDTALVTVFREVIGMTDADIQVLRDSPVWGARIAAAWSVVRECEADEAFLRDGRAMLGGITQPVLILSGTNNLAAKRRLASQLAGCVPGWTLADLPGQGHAAHHSAPAQLAEVSQAFFDRAALDGAATRDPAG